MKHFITFLILVTSSQIYSQCNYQTMTQNGVTLKQFNPMPIGGDKSKQIALSISSVDGDNKLSLTIRFLKDKSEIEKNIIIKLSDNSNLRISAERIGSDYIKGSYITHMLFSLSNIEQNKLLKY